MMRNRSRRTWLKRAAAGGAALAMAMTRLRHALAMGAVPPGVYQARGEVRINGKPAQKGVELKPGDIVTTGRDAELVVVVGKDAFLMRANSRVEYAGDAAQLIVSGLRVVTGALLSVFEPGKPKTIRTATATIGIRGTAVYIEIEEKRTYVCTCYGVADLVPVDDPVEAETVRTKHHDEPRFIYAKGMPRMMEKAPVFNHSDAELTMLESLVGRTTPFAFSYTNY
jgi:hypothetical protein